MEFSAGNICLTSGKGGDGGGDVRGLHRSGTEVDAWHWESAATENIEKDIHFLD
jgi:hypothetical protein